MKNSILILLLILLAGGCGGDRALSRQLGELDEAFDDYSQALRWGRYKDAERLQASPTDGVIPIDAAKLAAIRITGHAVDSKTIVPGTDRGEGPLQVEIKGEFQYYSTSSGTLRQAPFTHLWWFDADSKHWLLDGNLPAFR
jgi:hypothetical protein